MTIDPYTRSVVRGYSLKTLKEAIKRADAVIKVGGVRNAWFSKDASVFQARINREAGLKELARRKKAWSTRKRRYGKSGRKRGFAYGAGR